VNLTSGFQPDPHTHAITAGGTINASTVGSQCTGTIARAPDYRVNWTAGSGSLPLMFSVDSSSDTTLVINDAQGNWICDDDGGNQGLNPLVTIQHPPSGQYDVWVGTFGGGTAASQLYVSELYSQ
jgi:large exoprotein involved in heme utilization and adhesion